MNRRIPTRQLDRAEKHRPVNCLAVEKGFKMTRIAILTSLFVSVLASIAYSTGPPLPPPPAICVQYESKRNAAIKSQNWFQLLNDTQDYTELCQERYGKAEVSKAYGDMSLAFRKLNKLEDALRSSGSGIITDYLEPGSHYERSLALIQSDKAKEAETELDITELLSRLALKRMELKKISPGSRGSDATEANKIYYKNYLKLVAGARLQKKAQKKK